MKYGSMIALQRRGQARKYGREGWFCFANYGGSSPRSLSDKRREKREEQRGNATTNNKEGRKELERNKQGVVFISQSDPDVL